MVWYRVWPNLSFRIKVEKIVGSCVNLLSTLGGHEAIGKVMVAYHYLAFCCQWSQDWWELVTMFVFLYIKNYVFLCCLFFLLSLCAKKNYISLCRLFLSAFFVCHILNLLCAFCGICLPSLEVMLLMVLNEFKSNSCSWILLYLSVCCICTSECKKLKLSPTSHP
jgi:hypothetical protein